MKAPTVALTLFTALAAAQLSPQPPSWLPRSSTQQCQTMTATHSIHVINPTADNIKVRTCDKYNPVSGAPCVGNPLKPNAYVDCPDQIPAGAASSLSFNADTQYIAFTSENTELVELWPSASGAWPATYTVKPSAFEQLLAREETAVKHFVQPTTSHCEDVVGDTNSTWWKANGWKYASWTAGKCPVRFNFVNEVDHPAPRVAHRTLGVAKLMSANDICDPTGYVHAVSTEGGDKGECLEIAFGGGKYQSKFWQANGWRYSPPLGKEWSGGECDRTQFPTVASLTKDYDGWTDAKNSAQGCGGVNMTKYAPKDAVIPF